MPTFPIYRGELPTCLRLFKPSHYLLLAYWIYFRPTGLKCYFHQAVPELYDPQSPPGWFQRWGTPAYRNLYLMVPIVGLCVALTVSLPVTIVCAWVLDVPIDWGQWRDGVMFGVALGVMVGMAFGMVGSVLGGQALGGVMGIIFAVTIGVLGGATTGVALGVKFAHITDGVLVVVAIFGMLGGMATTLDVEVGIAVSLTFGMMGLISFVGEYLFMKMFGIQLGVLMARWILAGSFIIGAFRGILYPLQFLLACLSILPFMKHPHEWDELVVLPLPWTRLMFARKLRKDEQEGLKFLSAGWRNLLCRPALQIVLYRYLHKHPSPLRFFYRLLTNPNLEEYMLIPLTPYQLTQHETVRRVLLGEFALQHVEATQNPRFRRSAWWLNLHVYKRPQTPLTRFAGMLYTLLDETTLSTPNVELFSYHELYRQLSIYPDGQEIALSFKAMATFLAYRDVQELSDAEALASELATQVLFRQAIRPPVLLALSRLGGVGKEIAVYGRATDLTARLAALARTTGDLNDLNEYVAQTVIAPERSLLERIIQQWQHLLMDEIGKLGKTEVIV